MRINAYLLVAVALYVFAFLGGELVETGRPEFGTDAFGRVWQWNPFLAGVATLFSVVGLCRGKKSR